MENTSADEALNVFMHDYAESVMDELITEEDIMCTEELPADLPNCYDFDRFAKHMR